MKNARNPLLIIIFIFFGLFVYTKLFGPIPFSVNSITTTKANLFNVSGIGEATAIPDTAQFSIGVTKTASIVIDAQAQTNTAVNKIIDDLKRLGVEEKNIKTTNYSISPNYDFGRGGQNITGYTVTQTLDVKTPIDTASKTIDTAVADGANIAGGITFTFNDKTKKELEEKARNEAVKIAKEKAESLSRATGIRLGRIVDVAELGSFEPRPFAIQSLKAEQSADTQLAPGENSIKITITLSYETL